MRALFRHMAAVSASRLPRARIQIASDTIGRRSVEFGAALPSLYTQAMRSLDSGEKAANDRVTDTQRHRIKLSKTVTTVDEMFTHDRVSLATGRVSNLPPTADSSRGMGLGWNSGICNSCRRVIRYRVIFVQEACSGQIPLVPDAHLSRVCRCFKQSAQLFRDSSR